ncbi:MAG: hypothetical protein J6A21_11250 [Lentisphaeria bacterium]|nr:hypothetical protein [Lentisphaeria bacterium]
MTSIPGKIWGLPNTLIGLAAGLLGLCVSPKRSRIRLAHNAVCFYNNPLLRGGAIALTLGNVILFRNDTVFFMGTDIAEHERQHTLQSEVLGVLYLPLHILFLALYGRNVMRNPLERGPCSTPPAPWGKGQ